ncbi:MAG TPA: hypothetical protein VJZ06_04985 [Mobilitalea sp.]|nr:hypothetical protein [Mobilitalea sp.]
MAKNECCTPIEPGVNVNVTVNVTKIVKYLCLAGVFIVGIIFGTKCYNKMMDEWYSSI